MTAPHPRSFGGLGSQPFLRRPLPKREPPLIKLAFFFFWCLIFTIPWENMIVIPNLGTVAHLVGYLAVSVGILAVLDRGRLHAVTSGFLLLAAFSFWRCLSLLWTAAPDTTLIEVQTTFQMVAMVWLLHQLARSRKSLLAIMQAYVLGGLVSSGAGIYQYLHGVNVANQSRFSASGFDPNELALMLVLSIPMSLYLSSVVRHSGWVWLYRLQILLAAFAVLLTASRGPFLASTGILIFLPAVFFRASEKQKGLLVIAAALTLAAGIVLVPAASWKRIGTIGSELSSGTLNDRTVIWEAGLEVLRHNAVIGVGAGAFRTVVRNSTGTSYVAHNTFLSILVEQGLIGFGLFVALYVYSIHSTFRLPRFERMLWLSSLLVMTIGIFSLTWEYRKPMWLLFGLISLQAQLGVVPRSLRPRLPHPATLPATSSPSDMVAVEHSL